VAKVNAKGGVGLSENYNIPDIILGSVGRYFYRLKVVDNDGSFTYSDVESLSIKLVTKNKLKVFPNPTLDVVFISGRKENSEGLSIKVYNRVGQLVTTEFVLQEGLAKIKMEGFTSGIYIVEVSQGKEFYHYKLMKE